MESLVSYCSDEEESESYSGNGEPNSSRRDMERINRQGDEDTNYDNVQMDMSEESNNNDSPDRNSSHSDDSSDSEKTSDSSSHSKSVSSDDDRIPSRKNVESSHRFKLNDTYNSSKEYNANLSKKDVHSIDGTGPKVGLAQLQAYEKEQIKERKENDTREYNSRHDRDRDKDRGGKEQLRSRDHRDDRRSNERRSHSRNRELRSSPHRRERDRNHSRSKVSPDRKRTRLSRSRSPPSHSYSSSRHSDSSSSRSSKDSHRGRSRSRDRQSSTRSRSRERGSDRHRSRSKERQRSRSRERRRGNYEKKPNKLTILERLGIELRPPEVSPAVSPQQLLQRSIEQQVAQVKSSTGIELPKYYNPAAMNPARYAEQMQKRRLLWGNKAAAAAAAAAAASQEGTVEPKATSNNKWEGTTFAQDQDGKMTAKFKRLMGIKDSGQGSASGPAPTSSAESSEILKKQEELFNSMEMQYEVARVATHTHRGVGLGFGTFQYPR